MKQEAQSSYPGIIEETDPPVAEVEPTPDPDAVDRMLRSFIGGCVELSSGSDAPERDDD